MGTPLVRVVRSGIDEAVHHGSVAVVDAGGRPVASAGDADLVTFARSSMKPLQAAVSLSLAGEDLPDDEIAIMSGSHNGEDVHLTAVDAVLERAGLDRGALRTPPSLPLDADEARAAGGPEPILHNCSGNHAGLLLACVRRGWDLESYAEPRHPVQQAVLGTVRDVAGEPEGVGVDGCGIPVHALRLRSLAAMFAGLSTDTFEGAGRVAAAMRASPYLVAGRNRVCTALMQRVPDLVVKAGAEGLICGSVAGTGIAVKIEDGATRAADAAFVRVLELLERLDAGTKDELRRFSRPPVLGGGRPVGELVADFRLA